MQYHNSMQEKVAKEMMSLVQNLKQNSLLAGHIIRKDTEVRFIYIIIIAIIFIIVFKSGHHNY